MIPQVMMKLPPQAVETEEAVLGAILLEKDAYSEVASLLSPEIFYKDLHQTIYAAIQRLANKNHPIDLLTLKRELENTGFDYEKNGYDVINLTSGVASAANLQYHALILREKYMMRELIRISSEAQKDAYEGSEDVFESIEKVTLKLNALSDVTSFRTSVPSMSDNLIKLVSEIEKTKEKFGVTGVPTGFTHLDRVTAGWRKKDLIIIAGRPGMGKTSFLVEMALQAGGMGYPGAFMSLEMGVSELVMKMLSNLTEIDYDTIERNKMDSEQWEIFNACMDRLSQLGIVVEDQVFTMSDIKAKARKLKKEGKLEWLIVDYLQLVNGKEGVSSKNNREQEVSYISRSLKLLAKELDIPIIAIASLSRESERRGGKKEPMLSDLRDSGNIESDADMVIFVHRPDYYDILEDENGNSTKGLAQLIISKYRKGAVGRVNLRFFPAISKFRDYDSTDFTPARSPLEVEMMPGQNLTRSFYETDDDRPF